MKLGLSPLPIDDLVGAICASLADNSGAVIIADPGAGKTTRLAPAIVDSDWLRASQNPGVLMLQPRRVAARAAASRIAQEQGWALGGKVGYQIRFENKTSKDTRLWIMTEGILSRRIIDDPFLAGVGCVVLDEFHERSIHSDLALALLREIQETVRPDLRIVVMSATLNPDPVALFLGGVPVVRCPGRAFPVEISYAARMDAAPVWERAAQACSTTLADPGSNGHILVFLPGMSEMRRTQQLLQPPPGAEIHLLHSSVSSAEQDAALAPSRNRKVILSTNIAETSLTIDGVTVVIDSGVARVPAMNSKLGIDRLEMRRISKASADQRAGRAGRTAAGRCIRLWTQAEHSGLDAFAVPEIQRVDLAPALLALHAYGARDSAGFRWFEAPNADELSRSETLLAMLGAVNTQGSITSLGAALARLPLHPRLGCMVLSGARWGIGDKIAAVAAILEQWDGRGGEKARGPACESFSDLPLLLDRFEDRSAPKPYDVRSVLRARDQLLRIVESLGRIPDALAGTDRPESQADALAMSVFRGFPDRLTLRRASDPSRGVMVGQRGVVLDPESAVRKPELFVSLDPFDDAPRRPGARRGQLESVATESRVSLASGARPEWLEALFPHLVSRQKKVVYDPQRGKVIATNTIMFAGLPVAESATGVSASDEDDAATALADYLISKHGGALSYLSALADTGALLARMRFLHRAAPDVSIAIPDDDGLRDLLRDLCSGCKTPESVRDANGVALLLAGLTSAQRHALEKFAPTHLTVPSGHRHKLEYPALQDNDGADAATDKMQSPVLAVRLQELFGLGESPRVANGRVPVLLHLLGPNYRPVQVTTDLRNFWNTTYAEVRKELRGRYPKHPWPEAPWEAPPVAVGRRRR